MEWIEYSSKTVDEAITKALLDLETTSDNIEYEVLQEESSGFLGIFNKQPAIIKVRKKINLADIAREFLEDVFRAMDIVVEVNIDYNEEDSSMNVDMSGDNMGILIGKRGQTLDSLQVLLSNVVNKNSDKYVRVKLDTENYRERRKATLENLGRNIAQKVKRTKQPVRLEPMNPYERRIIHSILQNDKYVTTHSEGEEPNRRLVVTLKKNTRNRNYKSNSNKYSKTEEMV
ncbi:MAG: protein jag [Clostridiales bacterium]|nr:protein jag [Clostridiales bacterium]